MAFLQYDPTKVTVTVGGAPMSAFADGEMVTVEFTNDFRTKHIGTDGQGRHVKTADRSGTVTIRLSDYSPSNGVLTLVDLADVPVPITVTDKTSDADLFFAESCTLVKMPNMVKGKEAGENEWSFQFIRGTLAHTGAGEA
jgi:hypothetical protein